MKKLYCQYCGEPLEDKCDCEREAAESRDQFIEDYNNNPLVQAGWCNEDLIFNSRREQ